MAENIPVSRQEIQEKIRECIAQELRLPPERVHRSDHLIDLPGGSSTQLIRTIARLEEEFGIQLPKYNPRWLTTLETGAERIATTLESAVARTVNGAEEEAESR
ncbi:acyl carrier protein [Streptomyces sp. 11-1-2]|uniref:acyl carrier protein n=1 Tax=unclassified Streptomyces TaxID=2593676 RepID=UPI000B8DB01C|nr:acyl carrier protein [Streptomyces sp. 11-1-2]ASQ93472.1 hypothetical protein CGL27_10600 [Streptomyces sp. 11-1-2]